MALGAYGRQAVFDAVKARIAEASGVSYDTRTAIGTLPSGRTSYFVIGPRRTRRVGRAREQDGDRLQMETTFPCELAYRSNPHQREESRAAADDLADAMQRKTTVNAAGLETRWASDDETEVPSGEWIVLRFQILASYTFDLAG